MKINELIDNGEVLINYNDKLYELKPKTIIDKEQYKLDLKGKINYIQKGEGRRIIAGYASVAVADKEDQLIPIETLKKGIETLLKDPHYANLMLIHKNIQIGKIIESYKDYTTRVDDKGLFCVCEIRQDTKIANEIWQDILDGVYTGFSIGCEVIGEPTQQCDGDKCVTVLDNINIMEVSVCSSPINTDSGFIVISKSEFDKEYVCNECKDSINKMADKKELKNDESKETKEPEKKEEVETKKEEQKTEEKSEENFLSDLIDKLESIERRINAMEGLVQESLDKSEEKVEEPKDTKEKSETKEKEEKVEDKSEEVKEPETKAEEKTKEEPKTDDVFTDIKSQLEKLNERIDSLENKAKEQEYEMALKARDDQIDALNKKVQLLEKSDDTKDEKTDENETEAETKEEKGTPKSIDTKKEMSEPTLIPDDLISRYSKNYTKKQRKYQTY